MTELKVIGGSKAFYMYKMVSVYKKSVQETYQVPMRKGIIYKFLDGEIIGMEKH